MAAVGDISGEKLLNVAEDRIFSLGPRDLASALSYENMRYGLGKMIYALDDDDVCCVFGPDATITRNVGRWQSGFGYGAVIKWPDNGIIFPELRPNACGMLLAKIDELPSQDELAESIARVESSELYLDETKIKPDFGKGNHFLEFYKVMGVSPDIEDRMPQDANYVIIHGSASERKDDLYNKIAEGGKTRTPFGDIVVLDGSDAKEYYKVWLDFDEFSLRRREFIIKEVVGDCEVISNLTHQGMFSRNEVRLGCHKTMDGKNPDTLYPLALRWDLPVQIFRGKKNLTDDVISRVGFRERAERVGMIDKLRNINILPHGGGYRIDLPYTKIRVINSRIGNNFVLSGAKPVSKAEDIARGKPDVSSFGEMVIMNPHILPYDYRGKGVIRKLMEFDLGTPVAKLQPLMTWKV